MYCLGHHRTREEYLKNKEDEEARKAGTLPPQTDEEGRDINPHIPDYVKQSPWYLGSTQPTLKHQTSASFGKSKNAGARVGEIGARGFAGPAATKYRKGACANCGSLTHDAKSCLERPRKQGAKFTGRDIRPDELITTGSSDYATKHDPYARYDADDYKEVIERYERQENLRREARAAAEAKRLLDAKEKGALAAEGDIAAGTGDEFKVEEGQDNFGQFAKTDTRSARSVRDLRIREDTAKYLINRGEDAPFYDPKSRSMRANPRPDDDGEGGFAGDNQNRFTGDSSTFYDMQRFAWEHSEATQNATSSHVEASPSAAAEQFRTQQAQQKAERERFQREMLEQYGGAEHLQSLPAELTSTSETYTEYKRDGQIAGSVAKAIPKSRYAEDAFPGNHTSVWGSYYFKGKWGYKCCHQLTRSAYCTGTPTTTSAATSAPATTSTPTVSDEKPHKSSKSSSKHAESDSELDSSSSSSDSDRHSRRHRKKRKSRRRDSSSDSSSSSSSDSEQSGKPSKKKIKKYLEEEKRAKDKRLDDDRSRPYNSRAGDQDTRAPSAARMEAYYMAQDRENDPMQKMKSDDLL